ncbi:heavy metal-associated isoprenylated plant protein 47-like [Henckelia pumila]|uniref:heavy metal-associated isoprenylated plant protein 47-like n=1 Tax=Henckelia pumila TaxID=405737 RepID=UPI003C6DE378
MVFFKKKKKTFLQQKIVFRVQICRCKCPREALVVASKAKGVESVELEGQEKDLVAVVGDGIDIVDLADRLRKKLGRAGIVRVSPLD